MTGTDDMSQETVSGRQKARRTLADRVAQRARLRAERLARLQKTDAIPAAAPADAAPRRLSSARTAATSTSPTMVAAQSRASEEIDKTTALEEFLRALSEAASAGAGREAPAAEPAPASVLPFQRPVEAQDASEQAARDPAPAPVCDLQSLRGVGPGLEAALRRAGVTCRADLADLDPGTLATRLGPLGRLVPAVDWIESARAG